VVGAFHPHAEQDGIAPVDSESDGKGASQIGHFDLNIFSP